MLIDDVAMFTWTSLSSDLVYVECRASSGVHITDGLLLEVCLQYSLVTDDLWRELETILQLHVHVCETLPFKAP